MDLLDIGDRDDRRKLPTQVVRLTRELAALHPPGRDLTAALGREIDDPPPQSGAAFSEMPFDRLLELDVGHRLVAREPRQEPSRRGPLDLGELGHAWIDPLALNLKVPSGS